MLEARRSWSPEPPGTRAAPPPAICSPTGGTSAPWSVTTRLRPPPRSPPPGAELVRGDLDDPASLETAVRGTYGVYSVQSANPNELAQGTNVVDAAKAADVRHLVYSSVGGAESQDGFYLEHGWGPIEKWQIEQHIRSLGVPATILRPAGFMEDFTSPARFFQNGSLNVPWHDDLVMQLIAIDDIGTFAALAFANPDHYLGQAIEITGDRLTAPQLADALSASAGRPIPHTQIPLETRRRTSPQAPAGRAAAG